MFCPNCKAEYRAGFTSCADCNVELVGEAPQQNSTAAYVVLWRGEDPAFHDTLLDELENAGIQYADVPADVYLRNSENTFNVQLGPRFGFFVSLQNPDLAAARGILEKLLDREPEDISLEESGDEAYEVGSPDTPDVPLRWDPETATVQMWTGEDEKRARFLEASLRENGIPARILGENDGKLSVLVCPEDATAAREIMDQIAEASVPEYTLARENDFVWHDEPVRSYLFAWLPALVCYMISIPLLLFRWPLDSSYASRSFLDVIFAILSFVGEIGSLWMIYQAIRYEIRPWRFILLSFVPLSFGWYYYERYSRRRGNQRYPVAVRLRMSPPTA